MSKITDWLKLTNEQRRGTLESIEYTEGIQSKAAEKDWWVTLTLHALFLGKFKDHLVFKGGTSLSKCFNLIERFSEDIDIALAPEAVGMKYEDKPSKSFIKKLKRMGCEFTSTELKEDIERMFRELGVPKGMIKIEAEPIREDMPDADPQTLFIHYPSLFEPSEYLVDIVRIEVSVRSQTEP
jgi:predicted nucleotidyltransferase component of viral defense system